jgi:hypothetical protein
MSRRPSIELPVDGQQPRFNQRMAAAQARALAEPGPARRARAMKKAPER